MTFPRYEEYKDSGVEWLGDVPAHWETLPLKHICSVFPSNVDKKSYDDQTPVRLCNYTDVYYNEVIVESMPFMLATATGEQIAKFRLRAGDTIITKDSESANDIAIAAYVPADLNDVICGYHLSVVRPREKACGAFIKRFFDSHFARACFEIAANGLTRVGLSQYAIDNVLVPTPPVVEQTAIATFLNHETAKIDELVAEQQNLIALLKEKRQALISHAVTKGLDPDVAMKDSGVEWLGEVPAHWSITRLKHATRLIIDCPHETPHYSPDGDFMVIRTADLFSGSLNLSNAYRLDSSEYEKRTRRGEVLAGDIVYGREGERWGYAAIVPENVQVCLGQRMMQFRARTGIHQQFLMWQLNADSTYRQGQQDTVGATSPHVNISTIANYMLTEPSLREQEAIAQFLTVETSKLTDLVTEAESTIALLQERRTALISAAVTGKIDVRSIVYQPAEQEFA